jgi:hypothetical protein
MHPIPLPDSGVLQDTHTEATRSREYSSEETCSKISSAVKVCFPEYSAREYEDSRL